jgi:hypothetical protein
MILKQDFLLKDFAIISKTLILIEKKDYKKAKETIAKIDPKIQRINNNITNIICEIGNVCECIFGDR